MLELISSVVFPSLIASLGWGISPYFDKLALRHYNNNIVFMLRIIFAGILGSILFIVTFNKNKSILKNNLKGIKYILFSAFISIFIGTYFYYRAMSKSKNTTLVVLISYVLPLIFITLISNYILKEKINLGMCISLFIVIIGIVGFIYSSK